jgi:hypothetical protein
MCSWLHVPVVAHLISAQADVEGKMLEQVFICNLMLNSVELGYSISRLDLVGFA